MRLVPNRLCACNSGLATPLEPPGPQALKSIRGSAGRYTVAGGAPKKPSKQKPQNKHPDTHRHTRNLLRLSVGIVGIAFFAGKNQVQASVHAGAADALVLQAIAYVVHLRCGSMRACGLKNGISSWPPPLHLLPFPLWDLRV